MPDEDRAVTAACTHLDQINDVRARRGRRLPGLRRDRRALGAPPPLPACGHVGCCDDSPNRHATAHHRATGHPVIRSLEPGERWSWCYVDEVGFVLEGD